MYVLCVYMCIYVYIYVPLIMFHTPRPFSSPLLHQRNIFGEQHTSRSSLLCNLSSHFSLLPLRTNLFTQTPTNNKYGDAATEFQTFSSRPNKMYHCNNCLCSTRSLTYYNYQCSCILKTTELIGDLTNFNF